jgi:hypothetical protein
MRGDTYSDVESVNQHSVHSAAWYRAVREEFLRRHPNADHKSRLNLDEFVFYAEEREAAEQAIEGPTEIAARLGVSIESAREHQGRHRCVDGKRYVVSCLVSDRRCDSVARSYMHMNVCTVCQPGMHCPDHPSRTA